MFMLTLTHNDHDTNSIEGLDNSLGINPLNGVDEELSQAPELTAKQQKVFDNALANHIVAKYCAKRRSKTPVEPLQLSH